MELWKFNELPYLKMWSAENSMVYIPLFDKMKPQIVDSDVFESQSQPISFGSILDELSDYLICASQYHRYQKRKFSCLPYITHCIAVAKLIHDCHPTEVLAIKGALLHDTIEDTECTYEDLETKFPDVAKIVLEVTDDNSIPKIDRKRNQIASGPHKSREAKLIKISDKIHNCKSFCYELDDKEQLYAILAFSKLVIDGMRGTSEPLENIFDDLFFRHMPTNCDINALAEKYLERKQ